MKRKLFYILLAALVFTGLAYSSNHWLQTTEYTVRSGRIPKAFDGLRIVQISDLHDAVFGDNQSKLAGHIKKLEPDLIFITGDLIDSNRYNLQRSLDAVEKIVPLCPVYYVTGNHEVAVNRLEELSEALEDLGVRILNNESETIVKDGEKIVIGGIEDPLMKGLEHPDSTSSEEIDEAFSNVSALDYRILLAHRPEVFDAYAEKALDLVFAGHAHGGQFWIPGIGGLVAPGQGWFPEYAGGMHEKGITKMVVSRGLGNSIVPFRLFNRPEIVVVTLKSGEAE